MSCKTESKEIDGIEYSVTQWPADKSLLMKMRLLKIVGPSIDSLKEIDMKKDISEADIIPLLTGFIGKVFDKAEPEDVVKIIKDFIVNNVASSGSLITESKFTEEFSGDSLGTIYKVFFFVVKVNYSGLLKRPDKKS